MHSRMVFLASLAMAAAAQAATITVGPGGYTTVQAGVNAASPGDTVQVAPGTYYESITINKSLTLESTGGPGATILDGNSAGNNYYMVEIQASNVVVDGFTVTNPIYSSTADASGFVVGMNSRPSNVRVTNCIVHDMGIETRSPVSFGTFGFNVGPVDGLEIDHCQVYNIKNGDADAYAMGIFTWGNSSTETADNINIHDNAVHDISSPGDYVVGIALGGDTANATVTGNTVAGPVKRGITTSGYLDPGLVTIAGNTISGATAYGILLRSPYSQTLTGNTVTACATGIQVDATCVVAPEIHENSIAGNTTGLNNLATVETQAQNNWWGASNGPGPVGTGSGDTVSANVDYDPWSPSWPPPRTLVVDDDGQASATDCDASDGAFTTINAAVADANPGDTVHVCPGTYHENVNLNKRVTLQGSGSDPAGTVITPPSGTGIVVSASGSSSSERLVVKDLHVTGATTNGIDIAAANASYLTFENVACVSNRQYGLNTNPPTSAASFVDLRLTNCSLSSNGSVGFRTATYVGINGLTITDGHFDGNSSGMNFNSAAGSPLVTNVSVNGTTFNNNTSKGIYVENFDNATLSNITVDNSGTAGNWAAGIDINLKYHAFRNITLTNARVTNCGTGDAINGVGLAVKARDDGSYGSNPASLDNVQITCSAITGCQEGIRCGEPGKNNAGPTNVAIHNCAITGSLLKAIRNESQALADAKNNWWNANDAAVIAAMMSGSVDYTPWLTKPALCSLGNVVYLVPTDESVYVKLSEPVVVNLDVANLLQPVAGLQAMLHFSSTYFSAAPADVGFAPGGGVWNEAVGYVYGDPNYRGAGASGDLDTIALVDTSSGAGTTADLKAAYVTLKPIAEGVAQIVFRVDGTSDTKQTMFTMLGGGAIYPAKVNSTSIYIDGTAPAVAVSAATQAGTNVLTCANQVVEGTVNIAVTASDAIAGLAASPEVTVTKGTDSLPVTFVNESPAGTFNYTVTFLTSTPAGTWSIAATATDRAGNAASASGSLCFDRKITGTVELQSLDPPAGGLTRTVTFVATGGASKTWNIPVTFAEGSTTGSFTLTDVPTGTTGLSAKTAWNLRRKTAITLSNGQASAVSFTGESNLLGGDLNGSNTINVLDYGVMKGSWGGHTAGDMNGDGFTGTVDYSVMKTNWFKTGDPE